MSWEQIQKIVHPPQQGYAAFGGPMSLSGDTMVTAAPNEDVGGNSRCGAAYVFHRSSQIWALQQRIEAPVPTAFAYFGWAVALDGDTLAVAHTVGGSNNAVLMYTRAAGVWGLTQVLQPADALIDPGNFGYSLSLDGATLAIGAMSTDNGVGVDRGAVYIFERAAGVWAETAKLTGSSVPDNGGFGWAVSLDDDWLAISCPFDDPDGKSAAGSVYMFQRVIGVWSEQQILVASDAAAGDRLCWRADYGRTALSMKDDVLVAGCHRHASPLNDGAAYVFRLSGGVWAEEQKLYQASFVCGSPADEYFGCGVATDGVRLAIQATYADNGKYGSDCPGAVYIYEFDGSWCIKEVILPTRVHPETGTFLMGDGGEPALFEETLLVGSVYDTDGVAWPGAVRYFELVQSPARLPIAGLYIDEIRGILHT